MEDSESLNIILCMQDMYLIYLDLYYRTKVASTHGDHSVRVTDIATGKCLHTLRGHPRTPWSLAYHPSYSNIVASGCLGGQVRIWDLYVSL
jgi:activator-of-BECN1-regulated-autophagy protein 1